MCCLLFGKALQTSTVSVREAFCRSHLWIGKAFSFTLWSTKCLSLLLLHKEEKKKRKSHFQDRSFSPVNVGKGNLQLSVTRWCTCKLIFWRSFNLKDIYYVYFFPYIVIHASAWNASSAIPPLILWLLDITWCHYAPFWHNLCLHWDLNLSRDPAGTGQDPQCLMGFITSYITSRLFRCLSLLLFVVVCRSFSHDSVSPAIVAAHKQESTGRWRESQGEGERTSNEGACKQWC